MIKGYANIKIKAKDTAAALKIYTDALQMPLVDENTVAFPEGTTVTVIEGDTVRAEKSGFTHLCLDSCNADDGWARATDLGAVPSREDDHPTGGGGLYGGFLRFAGGEEVELWHICKNDALSEPYTPGNFVKAFVHTAITAPDKEKAIAFYEALGIRLKLDWGWGCSMQLANKQELEIFPGGDRVPNESGIYEVSFAVEDAKACYDIALANGGIADGDAIIGLAGERIRFVEGVDIKTVDLFGD